MHAFAAVDADDCEKAADVERTRILRAAHEALLHVPSVITFVTSHRLQNPHHFLFEADKPSAIPKNSRGAYISEDGNRTPGNFDGDGRTRTNLSRCAPALIAAWLLEKDARSRRDTAQYLNGMKKSSGGEGIEYFDALPALRRPFSSMGGAP